MSWLLNGIAWGKCGGGWVGSKVGRSWVSRWLFSPGERLCKKSMDPNNHSLDVCLHWGRDLHKELCKRENKSGIVRESEDWEQKVWSAVSCDLLVPVDLRTSCALGKANGLEVICGKYPSASGVHCQPGVSSAPEPHEMWLPTSLDRDWHLWPQESDPQGLIVLGAGRCHIP